MDYDTLKTKTITDLKKIAKEAKIPGYSKFNKSNKNELARKIAGLPPNEVDQKEEKDCITYTRKEIVDLAKEHHIKNIGKKNKQQLCDEINDILNEGGTAPAPAIVKPKEKAVSKNIILSVDVFNTHSADQIAKITTLKALKDFSQKELGITLTERSKIALINKIKNHLENQNKKEIQRSRTDDEEVDLVDISAIQIKDHEPVEEEEEEIFDIRPSSSDQILPRESSEQTFPKELLRPSPVKEPEYPEPTVPKMPKRDERSIQDIENLLKEISKSTDNLSNIQDVQKSIFKCLGLIN